MTQTMYLRTEDTEWVTANGGTYGRDGIVAVPVDSVETISLAGRDALRHTFTTWPKDGARVMFWPVALIGKF